MTATSTPFGLKPIRHINGHLVAFQAIPDGIASGYGTAIYQNSPVILNTSGNIVIGTTAADFIGVFAGCSYVPSNTGLRVQTNTWAASTTYLAGTMEVYVYLDPGIIYEIQANGSLAQTSVLDQADFVNPGTGTLGVSTAQISTTLAGAGSQAQLRIMGLSTRVDNAWGDAYTIVEVMNARSEIVANKVAV